MAGLVTVSEARYIRLVDRQPTQTRYTGLGDVTGSIKIGMKFKSTGSTLKLRTVAVPFIYMSADRALLRGVPGIDKDHLLTEVLCFVPDKLFQFKERPVVQFLVEVVRSAFLDPDLGQVFQCEHCVRRLNNLLRDAVINISHKPTFFSAHAFEFTLGGSRAFGLEFSSEISVLRPRILHGRRIKESVIGTDGDVDNTTIDPKNLLFGKKIRCPGFDLTVQVEPAIIPVKGEIRRFDFPTGISPVILGKEKFCFDAAGTCCQRDTTAFHIDPDHPLVVPHGRIFFMDGFMRTFYGLKRFTGAIPGTLQKGTGEIRNSLTNIKVSCMVAINLIRRMVRESPFCAGVEGHGVIPHGLQDGFSCSVREIQLQLDCPNHSNIFVLVGNILNGGDADALPPLSEGRGLRAAFG